ncbi:MAG: hypothetical protein AABY22_30235 [Nanoarchaeota archaeon]
MKTNKVFFLPPPQKFTLIYKKTKGTICTHLISAPIEANDEQFTAYSFGNGVRTFKKSGVISIKKW